MIGHGPFSVQQCSMLLVRYSRIGLVVDDKAVRAPDTPVFTGRGHANRAAEVATAMNRAYRMGIQEVFRNRPAAVVLLDTCLTRAKLNRDQAAYEMLTKLRTLLLEHK